VKAVSVDSVVENYDFLGGDGIIGDDIPFDLFRYSDDDPRIARIVLPSFDGQKTSMIKTRVLPQAPAPAAFRTEPVKKTAMGAATAT
jgi:hypothetical protein